MRTAKKSRTRATQWPVRWSAQRLRARIFSQRDERGDVPGWVMVTLMTAGLVAAIWVVAEERLTALLERALSSVGG